MPKLKESEEAKKDRALRAEIARGMNFYGLTDDAMAVRLRMSPRTWDRRKAHLDTLSLREFRALAKALHMDGQTLINCI